MSTSSGRFLTKSIILIAIVLISMSASLFLGKQLGAKIMDMTRSNIDQNFPDSGSGSSMDEDVVLDLVSGRGSFDYNQSEFGNNPFPQEWADPDEEEFEDGTDGPIVEIELVESQDDRASANDGGEFDFSLGAGHEETETPPEIRNEEVTESGTTYRIQVGTFSESENANNTWSSLNQAGFDASISTFTDDGVIYYRVQVGRFSTRAEADEVAEQLSTLNFDGWVYEETSE